MKRLAMRKIRDALRLAAEGHSARLIGASLDVGRTTVQEYLSRAKAAGLSWPLPEDLDDEALEAQLFPSVNGSVSQHAHPDWVAATPRGTTTETCPDSTLTVAVFLRSSHDR